MSGRKVGKADLIELARALGDDVVDEAESMVCIFLRCLDRARELGAPADPFGGRPAHPKVREWCSSLMDYADERHRELVQRGESEAEKWNWYTVYGVVRDSTGRPCVHSFAPGSHTCMRVYCHLHIDEVEVDEACSHKFVDSKNCLHCGVSVNVLKAKHRRELEQLEATGPRPAARAVVEAIHAEETTPAPAEACDHAGELAIDRATGEESCTDCAIDDLQETKRRQDTLVNHCLHTHYDGSKPECPDCGQSLQAVIAEDRQRANAEQWARTRGSRGAFQNQ